MQRIYIPNIQFSETLTLSDSDLYHQLTRVLRAKRGDEISFFDGENQEDIIYEISDISKKDISLTKKHTLQKSSDISRSLHLYQAYPNKLAKMELIVQKCTEVGYVSITFFDASYSQIHELSESKKHRLEKISIEASEQSGRNTIPKINYLGNLNAGDIPKNSYVCDTRNETSYSLKEIDFGEQDVTLFVGPEGGWSDQERKFFHDSHAQHISLGSQILRTETVGPVVGFYMLQKK